MKSEFNHIKNLQRFKSLWSSL